jgi:hypothetical protein
LRTFLLKVEDNVFDDFEEIGDNFGGIVTGSVSTIADLSTQNATAKSFSSLK